MRMKGSAVVQMHKGSIRALTSSKGCLSAAGGRCSSMGSSQHVRAESIEDLQRTPPTCSGGSFGWVVCGAISWLPWFDSLRGMGGVREAWPIRCAYLGNAGNGGPIGVDQNNEFGRCNTTLSSVCCTWSTEQDMESWSWSMRSTPG